MAMNEAAETKICPLCAEAIKAAAKVCPYCRKSQRRWAFCTIYDVTAVFALLSLLGALLLVIAWLNRERTFVPSRDRIEVLNSQFGVDASDSNTNVVVSGVLSNCSPYDWKVDSLEVRFFNKDGKMIDVMN